MAGLDPRLSGLILLYSVHGIDFTWFRAFGDESGHERSNAVRHENSVFHSVLKAVPWGVFDRAVAACHADKGVRRLSTRTQFTALLYGQLSGAASLRALVESFGSHARRLYHLGVRPVARSSLAEANAHRPEAVFSAVFAALVARAQPRLARQMGECVRLVDATTVRLSRLSESWARFSADVCGAKAHVIYDPDADCPTYVAVTPQRINDITAAKAMIAEFYKRRWAIELFFRWIKQTLKITHFIGRSENAVCIQIAVALIAYLLLRIVQTAHGLRCGMLQFARLVRSNLMHRKTPRQLLDPAILYPSKPHDHQLSLLWT